MLYSLSYGGRTWDSPGLRGNRGAAITPICAVRRALGRMRRGHRANVLARFLDGAIVFYSVLGGRAVRHPRFEFREAGSPVRRHSDRSSVYSRGTALVGRQRLAGGEHGIEEELAFGGVGKPWLTPALNVNQEILNVNQHSIVEGVPPDHALQRPERPTLIEYEISVGVGDQPILV